MAIKTEKKKNGTVLFDSNGGRLAITPFHSTVNLRQNLWKW